MSLHFAESRALAFSLPFCLPFCCMLVVLLCSSISPLTREVYLDIHAQLKGATRRGEMFTAFHVDCTDIHLSRSWHSRTTAKKIKAQCTHNSTRKLYVYAPVNRDVCWLVDFLMVSKLTFWRLIKGLLFLVELNTALENERFFGQRTVKLDVRSIVCRGCSRNLDDVFAFFVDSSPRRWRRRRGKVVSLTELDQRQQHSRSHNNNSSGRLEQKLLSDIDYMRLLCFQLGF